MTLHMMSLNKDDERGPIIEAIEIAQLVNETSKEVNVIDDEDDTLMEYCSRKR